MSSSHEYESKPLFGWKVLVPRTKEQAASLSDQLRSYGAMPARGADDDAVEPPRAQQMERAVKGLVTGRYEWIAFTSVNAVEAVGRSWRSTGWAAAPGWGRGGGRADDEGAGRLRREAGSGAERSADRPRVFWRTGRRTTRCSTPIDRVFLPRADIATETLVAGLIDLGLGGRRRHGLPDRAGLAAAGGDPGGDQGGRFGPYSRRPRPYAISWASRASRTT